MVVTIVRGVAWEATIKASARASAGAERRDAVSDAIQGCEVVLLSRVWWLEMIFCA